MTDVQTFTTAFNNLVAGNFQATLWDDSFKLDILQIANKMSNAVIILSCKPLPRSNKVKQVIGMANKTPKCKNIRLKQSRLKIKNHAVTSRMR